MSTPSQRSQMARVAALTRVANEGGDRVASHLNGMGKLGRYMDRVDPGGELELDERTRRAKALLRADMQRLIARRWAKKQTPT